MQLKSKARTCRTCNQEKHVDCFYRDKRYSNGDIHCADCRKVKVKKWRDENPERAKAIQRNSRERNPQAARDRARKWHQENRERHLAYMAHRRATQPEVILSGKLKSTFGIDFATYCEIEKKQGGGCAICGITSAKNKKRLAVDHCHVTNAVRGLLCSKCNQGIGLFNDSPTLLSNAISYLKRQTK